MCTSEKKIWDQHMHCSFSGDSDTPAEEMILRANQLHLPGITFTDHLDLDYKAEPGLFDLDLNSYSKAMQEFKANAMTYGQTEICVGIELGLQESLANKHHDLLWDYSFDEVIGSIHQIHGEDPYYPSFYEGKSIEEIYRSTFQTTYHNLIAFPDIDVLGHLDYVSRYIIRQFGNDAYYSYRDYADEIDAILTFLIQHDIALEINTGAYRNHLPYPNPNPTVLHRYHELGGKLITIGADAHEPDYIADGFDQVHTILKNEGYDSYYIYRNRTPHLMPL